MTWAMIARQYWNQGIATEACQGLIERVKQEGTALYYSYS